MKRLLSVLILALLPMRVIGDQTTDCQTMWAEVSAVFGTFSQVISETSITSDQNGWCKIPTGNLAILGSRLGEANFRVDEVSQFALNERGVEVELSGLQTPVGMFDGVGAVSLNAESGSVVLKELQLIGEDGRGVRVTADLALSAFMQDVSSNVEAQTVTLDLVVTPDFLSATGIDFSEVTRTVVDRALRDVSFTQVSGKSRRAFLGFVGAAPNARGTLRISGEGAGDVTIFQILRPFFSLNRDPSDAAITAAFDAAFEDIRVDLAWNPGRM
jgi:hypothetical protein